jgi:hypothetical protein
MDSDYDDPGPDNTPGPREFLDSDEVCNDEGQQPLGRDRTISSAVIVHAIDATRKQPTFASTTLSIHASVHRGAFLTRVNSWLG